ncbi:hypothetical protein N7494_007836 [Penicillium frequentans]|uniref:Phenol 2-monooxygenase n=1 Tax=Penicillium frequentans TaxID=3151616 RepID=A0AAD6CUV0_9EURO|nr:hypothetical protein N7494_007836 [Penicillium glabrum]
MGSSTSNVDLLIIGAGPAGLTAACWAAQYNMSTRIIDQKKGRTETGHADGVQSRSLEILESFGIVDSILKQGIHDVDMSHWSTNNETGKIERRRRYEQNTEKRSRFGQILLNQGAVEQVFLDHLDDKDVQVERHSVAEHLHLFPADIDEGEQFPVVVGVRCAGTYGRGLVRQYRPHARVFLTGDAAHTHSPKGGQGMNVSIQDSYNLIWKLGAVITNGADPSILETYDSERRPVAEKLMDLDELLVQAYEKEENDTSSGIYEVREKYAGFMAGVDVTYSHSTLIAKRKKDDDLNVARNIELGMRLPSFLVVQMCDGVPLHLAQKLTSNGWWRILVFPGDLRQPARMKALADCSDYFSKRSHLAHLQRIQIPERSSPNVESLLIQSCPRGAVNLLDLPELFHPFDDILGWDYWKTFADDNDQAYNGYGIDKEGSGCLVLCRPDQHVAWIGSMEDTADLDQYFSRLFPSRREKAITKGGIGSFGQQ